jgi:HEAT repeat protein
VRQEAAIVLGRLDDATSADALVDALGDGAWQVVKEALIGVARRRLGLSTPALLRLLDSEHADLRRLAAAALGAVGATEAMASLTRLVDDPDVEVRKAAGGALDAIVLAGRDA